ncbi:craniofacial development protein 2-like [Artemia franciscana]|uniref:craniofacial development protein 2-like n=1 Tax=Artemia franciscana TaxID=6661 RepID=UPI0032D9F731
MSQLSKTEQVLTEMKQYNIDILALSEIRWKGVGQETLDHGYVLLYSGEDNHHQAGVGLMMSLTAYRTMLKSTPINERILFARFATTHTKLSVIVCYAPTNEADDDVKDSFYETLQAVTKDIPKHDVLCVVGDLNAKVGVDRKYCPEVLGPHGLGQINENGALLVDFALSNDLVVGGTLFEHKNVYIKKYTWTSPDGSTQNQIDHFLIARRWRASLLDTQQDLKKLYDTNKLQDQKIRRDFCISLWNKFDTLAVEANDSESVEEKWEKIKSAYTTIAEEKLGFRKKPKETWISDITWKLIDERKALKQAMLIDTTRCSELARKQLYKETDKEVKKSARKDKRQLLEKKAALAEEASRKGGSKTVYRLTNEMVGKQSSRTTLVKDENGSLYLIQKILTRDGLPISKNF